MLLTAAEVTPGVTPVVDRFETQEPKTDNYLEEAVQKIGGMSGWELGGHIATGCGYTAKGQAYPEAKKKAKRV